MAEMVGPAYCPFCTSDAEAQLTNYWGPLFGAIAERPRREYVCPNCGGKWSVDGAQQALPLADSAPAQKGPSVVSLVNEDSSMIPTDPGAYGPDPDDLEQAKAEEEEGLAFSFEISDLETGNLLGGGIFRGADSEAAFEEAHKWGAKVFPGHELHAEQVEEGAA